MACEPELSRRALLAFAALLGSCGSPGEPPAAGCPDGGTVATWTNHAQPFLTTWCTSCHSAALPQEQRLGAPAGVDFDTFQGVEAQADRILERAVFTEAMPPVGGPSEAGRRLLGEWIQCGLPGGRATPPPPCQGELAVLAGDLVVTSAADLDTFCAQHDAVGGDLRLDGGPVALDCLCDVGGSLVVGGASSVSLPNLARVGGDVSVSGSGSVSSVDLPALTEVGGSLVVEDATALAALTVDRVETVGGDLRVERNPLLPSLWLDRLLSVAGDHRVVGNASLQGTNLDRVVTVGGDLVIEDNPALEFLDGDAYGMQSIGGDLLIRRNPRLEGFYGFVELLSIGGDLELVDNDTFKGFFGFTRLESLGGHLWIRGNEHLGLVNGFEFLELVPESLEIADNPELMFLPGFRVLAAVGEDPADPEFRLVDLPMLGAITGFEELTLVGAFRIERTGLPTLLALRGIELVGGDFTVVDNPSLPTAEVDLLVDAIGAGDIGGVVTIAGNAP